MERPESAKQWYVLWGGKSVGPWTTATVLDHLADRKLKGTDQIIGEGETEWRELRHDRFFAKNLKRRPRRKEKLRAPRPVTELIRERKKTKILKKEEPVLAAVTPPAKRRPRIWLFLAIMFSLILFFWATRSKETLQKEPLAPVETPLEKTRGPEVPKLPNPPGPATTAPEESDPNLLLKPPTRPQRP